MCPSLHVPVLARETIEQLGPQPGKTYVDGTMGGGGHTRLLAEAVRPDGCVLAIDADPQAVTEAEMRLEGLPVILANANFTDVPEILQSVGLGQVDGILLDLGFSSDQLADPHRGFSFNCNGVLDLRYDPDKGEPAWKLINRLSASHLASLIYQYGEERFSRRIARRIVEQRRVEHVKTATQLAELVRRCVPKGTRASRIDSATRTFQALRIAVNDELKSLTIALKRLPDCLLPGRAMAVISFHSLEDRLVKSAFRHDARFEIITHKPIRPTVEEVAANPRSRSARLRVARRV